MTLIPAFACNGGFVVHADSEENYGAFRRSVQKIVPQDVGQLRVIVAGSGIGELIEGFTDRLKERLDADNVSDVARLKRVIENRLPHFAREVENYPAIADDPTSKLYKFIVAAYAPATKSFDVWSSRGNSLVSVSSYELAGVEETLYDYLAQRLYYPGMAFSQAILAGLYLLTVAEATSSYVRAPYRVAVISARGIEMESDANVRAITERLIAYERRVNALFLACADTSLAVPDFEDLVDDFKAAASVLHRDHIDQQASRTSLGELISGSPLRPLPGMVTVGIDGCYQVEHDRQKLSEARKNFRRSMELALVAGGPNSKMIDGKTTGLRKMGCTNSPCGRVFFGVLTRAEGQTPVLEGTCPDCGKTYRIEHPNLI